MAKLEDLITPSEILEVIKGGKLKSELIKRYRTSEQELAKMLYPLYRGGELTKEEFNNFFKGVPLFQHETPAPPASVASPAQEPVDEPVNEPVSGTVDEPVNEPVSRTVDKPIEIIRSLQKFIGKKTSINSTQPEESAIENANEELSVQEIDPIIEEVVPPTPAIDIERLSVTETLQTIVDKLSSIDDRLSEIERKLGLD
jgi:hypothetical protein